MNILETTEIPSHSSTHSSIKVQHRPLKRIFDICFSLAALVAGAPLFILIAVLTALSSRGNVIYAHPRIGRGGKPFKCYKFRTMYADADVRLQELLANDPVKKAEWDSSYKLKDDPRITPIGHWLRKTSLDELPQFWNVLLGDLSVVGPRPVVLQEITTHFGSKASKILAFRPGLTGVWQVSGRSDVSYATRITLDEHYVDTQSLAKDIWIICKTIPCMLCRGSGAY
jgi:exopolysaccharide production protein ExoY